MKIGLIGIYMRKLTSGWKTNSKSLAILLGCLLLNAVSLHAFDRVENWGFDQGGGYRDGNFLGEDSELVVTCMKINPEGTKFAVGGALGDFWAVRIYSLVGEGGQPQQLDHEWNGSQDKNFSTITSMAWVNGKLACGVEYCEGQNMNASVLIIDPANSGFVERKLPGDPSWKSLSALRSDPDSSNGDRLWILGKRGDVTAFGSIDLNDSNQTPNITTNGEITNPRAMALEGNKIWICGESNKDSVVKVFEREGEGIVGLAEVKLGEDLYISAMETNEARVYLTGRSKSKNKMEDFLLVALDLNTNTTPPTIKDVGVHDRKHLMVGLAERWALHYFHWMVEWWWQGITTVSGN